MTKRIKKLEKTLKVRKAWYSESSKCAYEGGKLSNHHEPCLIVPLESWKKIVDVIQSSIETVEVEGL